MERDTPAGVEEADLGPVRGGAEHEAEVPGAVEVSGGSVLDPGEQSGRRQPRASRRRVPEADREHVAPTGGGLGDEVGERRYDPGHQGGTGEALQPAGASGALDRSCSVIPPANLSRPAPSAPRSQRRDIATSPVAAAMISQQGRPGSVPPRAERGQAGSPARAVADGSVERALVSGASPHGLGSARRGRNVSVMQA